MVPIHNCSPTITETLESVLANHISACDMQIAVVDDASSDVDLRPLISAIGRGRISYFRHDERMGAACTFNSCINRATGQWVHLLHGDDLVLPGFYDQLRSLVDANEAASAVVTRCIYIDQTGQQKGISRLEQTTAGPLTQFVRRLAVKNSICSPGIVVRRRAYEEFGGFRAEFGHAADWEMWLRLAAQVEFVFNPTPLACYRIHSCSDTAAKRRLGHDIRDAARVVHAAHTVDGEIDRLTEAAALDQLFRRAIESARAFILSGSYESALSQVHAGLSCIDDLSGVQKALRPVCELGRAIDKHDTKGMFLEQELWQLVRRRTAELLLSVEPADLESAYFGPLCIIRRTLARYSFGLKQVPFEDRLRVERLEQLARTSPESPLLAIWVIAASLFGSSLRPVAGELKTTSKRNYMNSPRQRLTRFRDIMTTIILRTNLLSPIRRRPAIAIAVGCYYPAIRGDALHAQWIARGLRDRGYVTLIIAPRGPLDPRVVDGIPVMADARIVRFCDVVITYSVNEITRQCGKEAEQSSTRWIHHPCTMAGGNLIGRADHILALSAWDERLAKAAGRHSSAITRLRPAVHPSRRGRKGEFSVRFGIEGEYILWAGAWHPAKGVRNLSERFTLFCNRHPQHNLRLVMFGGYGDLEFPVMHPRLTVLHGNVDDLPLALQDCLFVAFNSPPAPFGYDATPLFLLEAIMNEKTFVAQAGTPLLDEIGDIGIVVHNDHDWLEAVEMLVFDGSKRRSLEGECRKASQKGYNFNTFLTGIEELVHNRR